MAEKLLLDIEKDDHFQWVIRDCLLALREEGWDTKIIDDELKFVSRYNDDTKPRHPIMEAHRKLAEGLKHIRAELKMKRLNPHYRVKHLVYLAIMGEKDVRGVTNPKLIQELMENLDVSPQDEAYLIHRIKVTVEDCYFRMKKQGPHLTTIDNAIDVDSLLVYLELDRVGFMKKVAPTGLLYCVECQTSLADVISSGCHDVFCNKCCVETHSSGNRQDAQIVFIEQAVCSECECKAAKVRCQDCVDLFCEECFRNTHAKGKRQRHCVSLPQRTFCFECDEREASYICIQTREVLCTRCSARLHRSGARQNHTLFGLRKAAYNKRLFADNLTRLMEIMQKHVERSYSLNPWFIFYHPSMAPYWYNFQTNEQVEANVNDLINPPLPDEEEDESPDMQYIRQEFQGKEGYAMLQDTHAARYAAQSACFDVPPPLHVKFHSPLH